MQGVEPAVGYVFAWAVRRARRSAGHPEAGTDRTPDADLERLHALVAGQLGGDASLARAEEEAAGSGELTPRTRQRLELALEDAVERDARFAAALDRALAQLRTAPRAGPAAGDGGLAIGGNADIRADHGSAAAGVMGEVHLANPQVPGPLPQF